jgi:hypothetical protein
MFTKATRTKARLRLGIAGIAGVGKTYTALRLASAILQMLPDEDKGNGRIALVDTEHKSSKLYADEPNPDGGIFDFDAVFMDEWKGKFSIPNYIRAIEGATEARYPILIIDTISHAWNGEGGLLEFVDKNSGNNAFTSGWKKGTPLQHKFFDAMLSFDGHLICSMRSKPAYEMTKNSKGKVEPVRIGLQPIQRDGADHEFTVFGTMDADCRLTVVKTRCTALRGEIITEPGEDLARTLFDWLNTGSDAPDPKSDVIPPWTDSERKWFVDQFVAIASGRESTLGYDPDLVGYMESRGFDPATAGDGKRKGLLKRLRADDGWAAFEAWTHTGDGDNQHAQDDADQQADDAHLDEP